MKDLENLQEPNVKRLNRIQFGKMVFVAILFIGLIGAVMMAWKKTASVKKEEKKEIQIPVPKKNPEQDFTFYKNLKDKNELNSKKETIVGLIPPSTTPPHLTDATPESSRTNPGPVESPISTRFTLQVASMKDYQKALHLSDRLSRKGFPSYIIPAEIPEKGTYYRVRIGHYVTRKAAEQALEQLKRQGEAGAILARENVITKHN